MTRAWVACVAAGSVLAIVGSTGAAASPGAPDRAGRRPAAAASGQVVLIQAAPGMKAQITVDGKTVDRAATSGTVSSPVRLASGKHTVSFRPSSGGSAVSSSITVQPGSSHDVVLHFPASPGGKPVLSAYAVPVKQIGPGKARLMLAHTATVPPADVKFDGKTVFTNIANGEFAIADVPGGAHQVALLPSGLTTPTLLGPLSVRLADRTLTMVYAVGSPTQGSMNVITHVVRLQPDGAARPTTIRTGSSDLVAGTVVRPFSRRR